MALRKQVPCDNIDDFEVESLYEWWAGGGAEWVASHARKPTLRRTATLLSPEIKQVINRLTTDANSVHNKWSLNGG
eukprot:scaffold42043_cov32-Prasinocladus_malaysianus.AAC.2